MILVASRDIAPHAPIPKKTYKGNGAWRIAKNYFGLAPSTTVLLSVVFLEALGYHASRLLVIMPLTVLLVIMHSVITCTLGYHVQ